MKKTLALGLAAAIGLGSLAVASEANAKPMFWPHPHGYSHPFFPHSYGYGYPRTGFFFGFGFGPQYPIYPTYPAYLYPNKHVQWCAQRYRTYNPATDTFHPTLNSTAVCVSPWWTYR